jgi:hypothetical protein
MLNQFEAIKRRYQGPPERGEEPLPETIDLPQDIDLTMDDDPQRNIRNGELSVTK